jgi:hypothetical protein
MANDCYTYIDIQFSTEKEAKGACDKIDSWCEKISESGHDNWLGNVCVNAGIMTLEEVYGSSPKYRCRGSVEYTEVSGDTVQITTDTAWSPMLKMWKAICEKHFPEAEIVYSAEEPGAGIFFTNDPVLVGCYNVDLFNDDVDPDRECSEESLRSILIKLLDGQALDFKQMSTNGLIRLCEEEGLFDDIIIHRWEYVAIEDLD